MGTGPNPGRVPLPPGEAVYFDEPTFTPEACVRLAAFFTAHQRRNLVFFLSLRERWLAAHPGAASPACARTCTR